MADYGNIAGVVKSFVEPKQSDGSPKRSIIWARERASGSLAVDLLVYDFILNKWVPLLQTNQILKVKTASLSNLNSLTGISSLGGVTLANNDRVILTAQSDAKVNGVYQYQAGALTRAPEFTDTIPANHLVYVTSGISTNAIFYSENTANAISLTVDTDNLGYSVIGGITDRSRSLALKLTSDADASVNNFRARLVDILNTGPVFDINPTQDLLIRHTYQTAPIASGGSRVSRLAVIRLNPNKGQIEYGTGKPLLSLSNTILISPLGSENLNHPDEISLNGMGGYDFANSEFDISATGQSQHDFNLKTASAYKKSHTGYDINLFGQLTVKKIAANTDMSLIQVGDRVVNSNLNGGVFLIVGEFDGTGNPLDIESYDPDGNNSIAQYI